MTVSRKSLAKARAHALSKRAQLMLALVFGLVGTFGLITLFFSPAQAGAQAALPLSYTFGTAGTLTEAGSAAQSTSPYFWLDAGAKFVIANGVGRTIQGTLAATDPWHVLYATQLPIATDSGAHPQNVFKLFARSAVENTSVQVYANRAADNISLAANRQAYNGESLIARYKDANTYYYAGIRADGNVVIKKKTNGAFQTLASAPLFSGTYNAVTNPDLIPLGKWVGLKFVVANNSSGVPVLSFYTDVGQTSTWKLAATATDSAAQFGAPIVGAGLAGIESDFADATFDNFLLADSGASTSSTPPPPSGSSSYDSVVLSGSPALFLAMNSSSGTEADKSGHGHTGTYKGGTPASATLPNGDKAADFNGSSQYLTVPSSSAFSIATAKQMTWEAWIRPDTFSFANASEDGYVDWMGKCDSYSPTCEWEARLYSASNPENRPNRLSAYVFNNSAGLGSGADWQPASGVLSAGQWIHVVAEYQTMTTPSGCSSAQPGTINIWVNGIKQSFPDHAPTGCMSQYGIVPKASNSALNIGTMAMDTWFKGAVGKVAIYDRLLSQTEINSHYSAMTGKAPSGSCGDTCSL